MTDVSRRTTATNFEIFAYYCGISRTDATQARIKSSVDHWLDINGLDDDRPPRKIADDGIDILVDLNGYTKDARTKVFALRRRRSSSTGSAIPARWAAPYHHYIIADAHIIPAEHEIYYSEKVLRLPCYQPNDRKRVVAERRPTRADERAARTTRSSSAASTACRRSRARTFERWMTILRQVPGSVLWLLTGTERDQRAPAQMAAQTASRRSAWSSPRSWPTPSISPAIRWPTCSSTPSPTAPTRRRPMPCGWACRC